MVKEMKVNSRAKYRWYWLPVLLVLVLGMVGCGGGSSSGDGRGIPSGDEARDKPSVLLQPKRVTATSGESSVVLSWEAVNEATHYTVYWSLSPEPDPKSELIEVTDIKNTSWAHNRPVRGKKIYYVVVAEDGTRSSEPSGVVFAKMELLETPRNVEVIKGEGELTITWDSVPGAQSYILAWRDENSLNWDNTVSIGGENTQWIYEGAIRNMEYSFRISAVDGEDTSCMSDMVSEHCDKGMLPTPQGLRAVQNIAPDDDGVTLYWNTVVDADSYTIYWSESRTVDAILSGDKCSNIMGESYAVEGLEKGKTYYFVLVALDGDWCSDSCAPVSSFLLDGPIDNMSAPVGRGDVDFAKLPAGSFWMGSPDSGPGLIDNEDLHRVTFTHDFYMMTTEVTQQQWKDVMGTNPSNFTSEHRPFPGMPFFVDCFDSPVESVSWPAVQEFIDKLNEDESQALRYRLPTEAEWEYAARAGTSTPYAIGDGYEITESQARFNFDSFMGNGTVVVGSFNTPNAWGLHDMHGNVAEWVADAWQDHLGAAPKRFPDDGIVTGGSVHCVRGGNWSQGKTYCRSARRVGSSGGNKLTGFRLAADLR
ncbi:SUMF1/EgtB/PvdO family nonheme iron enzyme [Desulfoluna spongiiphila]|nr:SUMF1/EgtB/PvdO family nonheme iron enzyme [Desulfoluna spongiiphila]